MKITHEHIFFNSGKLVLEGVLSFPQETKSCPGVAICHPHPLYGGDLNNNVVLGIKAVLQAEGFLVLRFNFRGVTLSEGRYDEGNGEVDDVIAAVNFLKNLPHVDPNRIFLAGYSFGAWVGLRAALKIEGLTAVAGVSPPCGVYDFSFLRESLFPVFLVCGDHDHVCSVSELNKIFAGISSAKKMITLDGADHFYGGREGEVGEAVKRFFSACL